MKDVLRVHAFIQNTPMRTSSINCWYENCSCRVQVLHKLFSSTSQSFKWTFFSLNTYDQGRLNSHKNQEEGRLNEFCIYTSLWFVKFAYSFCRCNTTALSSHKILISCLLQSLQCFDITRSIKINCIMCQKESSHRASYDHRKDTHILVIHMCKLHLLLNSNLISHQLYVDTLFVIKI